ncbi:MAG: two-component system response regulator [Desulfobacteraceae bacterium]|nr:two-component system response regulator [Desulfobacteraceae bacterium]
MRESKRKILVVDDTPENLDVIKEVLADKYTLLFATNGKLALKITMAQKPDLILLDIMMPEMDGYEVCRRLKTNPATRDIPIIFLTAKAEIGDEARGLSMGAADYITKPITPPILKARIVTQLTLTKARNYLKEQNLILEEKIAERTREISMIQDVTMVAMGALAETRDPETGNHIRRTQNYVRLLAENLQNHPRFSQYLTPEVIQFLHKSAPLHDIGKVGVPDHILLKPGKLTDDEFEIMKKHTICGHDAIIAAESILDEKQMKQSFLHLAKEIAYSHHEKWDGSGYPEGLSGDEIPVSARLMALADVYDALISRRVYKEPFSQEKSVAIIKEGRGSHFDPDIADAFIQNADAFFAIARQYIDTADSLK